MMRWAVAILTLTVLCASLEAAIFSDGFEGDTAGSFPSKWVYHNDNADAVVVDGTSDPTVVLSGDKALQVTFNGGYASGVITTFAPVTEGIVSFAARVDSASDDLQLMGLHNSADTEAPGNHLITVSAGPRNGGWEYIVGLTSTGIQVPFGEYVLLDFVFDTAASSATLYIGGAVTNIVDYPFFNPSSGVTTLRSCDDTGAGTAQWYLDDVEVVPEPATVSLLALGLGAVFMRKRRKG